MISNDRTVRTVYRRNVGRNTFTINGAISKLGDTAVSLLIRCNGSSFDAIVAAYEAVWVT